MSAFFTKHSTCILLCLLVSMLVLAWLFPWAGLKLGIAFLLLSFFIASMVVLEKQKPAYRSGKITRHVFIRNAVIEILGTGLVMGLAGPLGRTMAEVATQSIQSKLLRVIAGIMIGL